MKIKIKLIFFLLILLSSCEKETDYEIPLILTGEVTNVTEEGVTLNAKISNLPNINIIEYGFEISNDEMPSSTKGKIVIGEKIKKGVVSYNLNSGLYTNTTYGIRSFIKTEGRTIYGNPVSFKSKGSHPPEIKNFYPKEGPIGTKVVIEGDNFGYLKDETVLQFGNKRFAIDSLTNSQIFVTIPQIDKSEDVKIAVITANVRITSQETFSLWFPWTKLEGNNNNFWCETHFQINNKGYMIHDSKLYVFDLERKKWEESANLPANCGTGISSTATGDKAYILFEDGFWEFTPEVNQWVQKATPPLSVKNLSYPELLYYERYKYFLINADNRVLLASFNNNIWEFNSSVNTWQELPNTEGITGKPSGSFAAVTSKNVYLGFNNGTGSEFWRFNPAELKWNNIGDLPINSYSFWGISILQNNLYLGFGRNHEWPSESSDEMWEYNIEKNKWFQFHNCPEKSIASASFSYNNKGYFITPWYTWEFDPLKN